MSQIVTKFITDNAVTDLKERLRNNQPLRSRNATDSGDVSILFVNTSDVPQLSTITEIGATPTTANGVANKTYVDTAVAGVAAASQEIKAGVVLIAQSNITLSGNQTIDGTLTTTGDRVLVNGQTTGSQNGIYVAAAGAWSRATDMAAASTIKQGCLVFVLSGNQYGQKLFACTNGDPITVGTTSIFFEQKTYIWIKENVTLSGTNITNQYIDLSFLSDQASLMASVNGVLQYQGSDYTLSTVGVITRFTFFGDLATGGAAALIAGDVVHVQYRF